MQVASEERRDIYTERLKDGMVRGVAHHAMIIGHACTLRGLSFKLKVSCFSSTPTFFPAPHKPRKEATKQPVCLMHTPSSCCIIHCTSFITSPFLPMSRHSQSSALLSDGFRIAYQQWQGGSSVATGGELGKRCLCLHGWLDNSNSFSVLGPYLADRGYTVVAIDHIGHGHSSHSPNSALNQFPKVCCFHLHQSLVLLI